MEGVILSETDIRKDVERQDAYVHRCFRDWIRLSAPMLKKLLCLAHGLVPYCRVVLLIEYSARDLALALPFRAINLEKYVNRRLDHMPTQ